MNTRNCCFYINLSKIFHLNDLREFLLSLCLKCFLTNYNPNVLLELSFTDMMTLVLSPNLKVDSELEIFNAVVSWVSHKKIERKFCMDKLLNSVRLPLLTEEVLTGVVKEHPLCRISPECENIINKALEAKRNKFQNLPKYLFENRYNCHKNFSRNEVLFCGGELTLKDNAFKPIILSHKTEGNTINEVEITNNMVKQITGKCVCTLAGTQVYCFIGDQDSKDGSFQVYCQRSDAWKRLKDLPERRKDFSTCSFMGKVYVFGGSSSRAKNFVYDPGENNWKKISRMIAATRLESSCAAFNGQCVVVGGHLVHDYLPNQRDISRSVETYDHHVDEWSRLPNLNVGREQPGLMARGNKLFVIHGDRDTHEVYPHEVYDCLTRKFTFIAPCYMNICRFRRPFLQTDGDKIFVFDSLNHFEINAIYYNLDLEILVNVYDIAENKWYSTRKKVSKFLRRGYLIVDSEKYLE